MELTASNLDSCGIQGAEYTVPWFLIANYGVKSMLVSCCWLTFRGLSESSLRWSTARTKTSLWYRPGIMMSILVMRPDSWKLRTDQHLMIRALFFLGVVFSKTALPDVWSKQVKKLGSVLAAQIVKPMQLDVILKASTCAWAAWAAWAAAAWVDRSKEPERLKRESERWKEARAWEEVGESASWRMPSWELHLGLLDVHDYVQVYTLWALGRGDSCQMLKDTWCAACEWAKIPKGWPLHHIFGSSSSLFPSRSPSSSEAMG